MQRNIRPGEENVTPKKEEEGAKGEHKESNKVMPRTRKTKKGATTRRGRKRRQKLRQRKRTGRNTNRQTDRDGERQRYQKAERD